MMNFVDQGKIVAELYCDMPIENLVDELETSEL